MKKALLVIAVATFFAACNDSKTDSTGVKIDSSATKPVVTDSVKVDTLKVSTTTTTKVTTKKDSTHKK